MTKAKTDLFFLNVIVVVFYFIVFAHLRIGISKDILFSTPDSRSYIHVTDYFINGSNVDDAVSIRPFLYPLIILCFFKTFGAFGLWGVQFLFWILSINLLFLSLKKATNNRAISYAGALIVAVNLSLIALTLHALTETTTIFLLSIFIYLLTYHIEERKSLYFFHSVVLIFVLLSVVKPLFYPIVVFLLLLLPFYYLKNYLKQPKRILILLFVLSPLIAQLLFMKTKYDVLKLSTIDTITFRDYLFAQGVSEINHMERDTALVQVKIYSKAEMNQYILNNKAAYLNVFLTNVSDNCKGYPTYLDYPAGKEDELLRNLMIKMNRIYCWLHLLLFIPILYILVLFLRKKRFSNLIILFSSTLLLYYILFSSGISAYQGDRLTLPGLPLMAFVYSLAFYFLRDVILVKFNSTKNSIEQ